MAATALAAEDRDEGCSALGHCNELDSSLSGQAAVATMGLYRAFTRR